MFLASDDGQSVANSGDVSPVLMISTELEGSKRESVHAKKRESSEILLLYDPGLYWHFSI